MFTLLRIVNWFIQGRPLIDNKRARNRSLALFYGLVAVYLCILWTQCPISWAQWCLLPILGSLLAYWLFSGVRFYILLLVYGVILSFVFVRLATDDVARWNVFLTTEFDVTDVALDDYPQLDKTFYEEKTAELQSHGFRWLADWENQPQSKAFPELTTVCRCLVHADGTIAVGVGQLRFIRQKNDFEKTFDVRIIEFSTEFSDGLILNTADSQGIHPIESVEGIVLQQFPPGTATDRLLQHHRTKLEELLADGSRTVRCISDKHDLFAASYRAHEIFCQDRRQKGLLTDAEIERMTAQAGAGKNLTSSYLKAFRKQAGTGDTATVDTVEDVPSP